MAQDTVGPHDTATPRDDKVSLRLPASTRGRLELQALLDGVPLSEIVRRAIERELERQDGDR